MKELKNAIWGISGRGYGVLSYTESETYQQEKLMFLLHFVYHHTSGYLLDLLSIREWIERGVANQIMAYVIKH